MHVEHAAHIAALEFGHHLGARAWERKVLPKNALDEILVDVARGPRIDRRIERREVPQCDLASDRVLELTHVAWPGVVLEAPDEARGHRETIRRELGPEELREHGDVTAALPKRRKFSAPYGEAVEQIIAKAPSLYFTIEIAPRCRD